MRHAGKAQTSVCPEISCLPAEMVMAFDNQQFALAFAHRWTSADPSIGRSGGSLLTYMPRQRCFHTLWGKDLASSNRCWMEQHTTTSSSNWIAIAIRLKIKK